MPMVIMMVMTTMMSNGCNDGHDDRDDDGHDDDDDNGDDDDDDDEDDADDDDGDGDSHGDGVVNDKKTLSRST